MKQSGKYLVLLYQYLTSKYLLFLAAFCFGVIATLCIFWIIPEFVSFYDIDSKGKLSSSLTFVHVFVGSILAFTFIYDMVLHRRKIRQRGLFWYFWFSDPLYYRVELLVGGGVFLFFVVPVSVSLIVAGTLTMRDFDTVYRMYKVSHVFTYVLDFCFQFWQSLGGFAVVVELYRIVRRRDERTGTEGKQAPSVIENIMQNEYTYKLMADYSASEFSSENVFLWTNLFELKQKDQISLDEICEVFNSFIKVGSTMEVNVPSKTRIGLQELIKRYSAEERSEIQISFEEAFTKLYFDVAANLSDTYVRMSKTPEYKNHEKVTNFQQSVFLSDYSLTNDIVASYNLLEE